MLRVSNRPRSFVGGIFGVVVYTDRIQVRVVETIGDNNTDYDLLIDVYCIGRGDTESANEESRIIGNSGPFGSTRETTGYHKTIIVEVCYNIGNILVESPTIGFNNVGGIVGYDSHIRYGTDVTVDPKNFYLLGTAPGAGSFDKEFGTGGDRIIGQFFADSDYIDDILVENNSNKWGKVRDSLKKAFDDEDAFGRIVDTWYPTLENNPASIFWNDYFETFTALALNTFAINNAHQLAYLSHAVNNGIINTQGITFRLVDNIDLAGRYFTPIGTEERPFRGTFDGDGFAIRNLTVDGLEIGINYGALFGHIQGATIMDLSLTSPIIQNVSYAAALVYSATGQLIVQTDQSRSVNRSQIRYVYTEQYYAGGGVYWGGIQANILDGPPDANGDPTGKVIAAGLVAIATDTNISRSYNNIPIYAGEEVRIAQPNPGIVLDERVDINEDIIIGGLVGETRIGRLPTSAEYRFSFIEDSYNAARGVLHYSYARLAEPLRFNGIIGSVGAMTLVERTLSFGAFRYVQYGPDPEDPGETIYRGISIANRQVIQSQPEVVNGPFIPGEAGLTSSNVLGWVNTSIEELTRYGWDMVNVWTSEYTMNLNTGGAPSIRGLGESWANTESDPLYLSNFDRNLTLSDFVQGQGQRVDYIYYHIDTPEQLAWVANNVNNGNLRTDAMLPGDTVPTPYIFKLGRTLSLEGRFWTPIGTLQHPFRGIFDFGAREISGMVIDSTSLTFAGLLGYTNNAVIRDGTIKEAYVKINNSTDARAIYAGAVVGSGFNTSILRMTVAANVYAQGRNTVYAGGVAGVLTGSQQERMRVENVSFSAPIESAIKLSASVFENTNEVDKDRANSQKHFSDPDVRPNDPAHPDHYLGDSTFGFAVAAISTNNNAFAAGIVAQYSGSAPAGRPNQAYLGYCQNTANILAYSHVWGQVYAGGISAYLNELTIIENVMNRGNIKTFSYNGREYLGGIIGVSRSSTITNAYNTYIIAGAVRQAGYLEPSFETSQISYVGGIVGYMESGTVLENTINASSVLSTLGANIRVGGIFAHADPDFEDGEHVPATLKGHHIFLENSNYARGYAHYGAFNETPYDVRIHALTLNELLTLGSGVTIDRPSDASLTSPEQITLNQNSFGPDWRFGTTANQVLPTLTVQITVVRPGEGVFIYMLVNGVYERQDTILGEIRLRTVEGVLIISEVTYQTGVVFVINGIDRNANLRVEPFSSANPPDDIDPANVVLAMEGNIIGLRQTLDQYRLYEITAKRLPPSGPIGP
jgi:hypothetical protein